MPVSKKYASHHKVDASLHTLASSKARAEGISMSAIASRGLSKYIANVRPEVSSKAKIRVNAKSFIPTSQSLPESISDLIVKMDLEADERLLSYLGALHNAGWSYALLAKPLGISRQGVHLRLSKWNGQIDPSLPLIPRGKSSISFPAHPSHGNQKRFDWAIWTERDLYAIVSEQARENNEQICEVLESVLVDYINEEPRLKLKTNGIHNRQEEGK